MVKKQLLIFSLLFISSSLFAQEGKLNFYLRALLNDPSKQDESVNLYVTGNHEQIKAFTIEHKGVYKSAFSKWSSIYLSVKHIRALAEEKYVSAIHYEGYKPFMMNDTMRIRNNIDSAQNGNPPLSSSYKGNGVISAIIDTGIDFNHPDFQDVNGATRVIGIWDQTQPYDALRTPVFGYGIVWDSTDINLGICTEVDNAAHGTTVAGAAAGNGLSTNTHWGVAPESQILIVKNNLSASNWTSTIADALEWIFYVADSLDLPVSVNISLGTYDGSHDGRDPAAVYIDSLIRAKNGRLVAASAGNSGNSSTYGSYHLSTTVGSDTTFTWFRYNPASGFGYGAVFFELWADTLDFQNVQFAMGADVTTPNYQFRGNSTFRTIQPIVGGVQTDTIFNGANILGIVDYYAELMGDVYLLQVHMYEPDSNSYNFRFMTTGTGKFDVWAASWMGVSNMEKTAVPTVAQFPDMVHYSFPDSAKVIVSSFQCLPTVVTVANYYNYQQYIDYAGNLQVFTGIPGNISINSSRGPTRDDRQKPEVASTGDLTMSAAPLATLAYQQVNEPFKVAPDGWHSRNGGTSMASPVVSGVGALLLEKCPTLSWQDFQAILMNTAVTDGFTGVVPNITYGYGKLNGFRALVETNFTPTIVGDTSFCEGSFTTLVSGEFYDEYNWTGGATTGSVLVDSTATIEFSSTDTRGCKSDTASISVIENPLPLQPTFTYGNFYYFETSDPAVSYDWYGFEMSGDVLLGVGDSINIDPFTFFSSFMNVYLVITDANGCQRHSDTTFINLSGIQENNENFISVYPNPSNGESLFISCSDQRAIQTVKVYDLNGKLVFSAGNSVLQNRVELKLKLNTGVYFLEITGESGIFKKKLIVAK